MDKTKTLFYIMLTLCIAFAVYFVCTGRWGNLLTMAICFIIGYVTAPAKGGKK